MRYRWLAVFRFSNEDWQCRVFSKDIDVNTVASFIASEARKMNKGDVGIKVYRVPRELDGLELSEINGKLTPDIERCITDEPEWQGTVGF